MAAKHDLTLRMIPFLDRHLVFPLTEFLELKEVNCLFLNDYFADAYNIRCTLLMIYFKPSTTYLRTPTWSTSFLTFIRKSIKLKMPQKVHFTRRHSLLTTDDCVYIEFSEKREQVLSKMEELRAKAQTVMETLEKPEVIAALRQDKAQNLQYLKDNYKVILLMSWLLPIYIYNVLSLPMIRSTFYTSSVDSNTTAVIMEELLITFITSAFW